MVCLEKLNVRQKLLLLFLASAKGPIDPIRIMKGMFIFVMEAPKGWMPKKERYRFIPYNFGPCSFDIYRDLQQLDAIGFVDTRKDSDKSWNYYFVTLTGNKATKEIKKQFPPKAINFINKIREFVDEVSFRKLLETIYQAYPKYSIKSLVQN